MTRARKGMTMDEIRQIWLERAEAKTKAIMDRYRARQSEAGGYGHEGLGIYGISQERAAREKVRLAAKLLATAGLEVTYETIRKVTGQSSNTISRYWVPPKPAEEQQSSEEFKENSPRIIRFPGR